MGSRAQIICLVLSVFMLGTEALFQKCKSDDNACMLTSANAAYAHIVAGDAKIGLESSDPLFTDNIEGNFANLKFMFTNGTLEGLSGCVLENLKNNVESSSVHVDLVCPSFYFYGDYVIDGILVTLPVEGSGKCYIKCKKYRIGINANMNTVTGADGNSHLHIKSFNLDIHAEEGIVFDFRNLFNGDKELSDAVHRFANENWKIVAEEFQKPMFEGNFKKLVKNVNKFLKHIPKDDFVQ